MSRFMECWEDGCAKPFNHESAHGVPYVSVPCPCVCHTGDLDVGPRKCIHCMTSVRVLPVIDIPLGPRDVA